MLDQMEMFTDRQPLAEQVRAFEAILAQSHDWMTASQLSTRTGWSDRVIRALAEASPVVISGQRGYRHVRLASPDEVRHFCHWMSSQATTMLDRVARVRRTAHAMVG